MPYSRMLLFCCVALAGAAGLSWPGQAAEPSKRVDRCRECHQDEKFRVQNKKLYDYFQDWLGSAHDLAGLSCTDCHGGDASQEGQEEAHQGVLPQSHAQSPFNYKNIPQTCGGCHPQVLQHFQKSRHYAQLKASGRGPSCITCHGSLDARVYSTTIVERSCANCHNAKSRNRPQVTTQAKEILGRLNHANGYRKGLSFYYKSVGRSSEMAKVDAAYRDVVQFWHEYDFKRLDVRSRDLLAELKALYMKAQQEGKERRTEQP
ncbi:MAG: hypothetical protein HY554_11835 [Elusimicrobia bacterium]|nr:hypothetical protein [Elusimicrobiota bacterium]